MIASQSPTLMIIVYAAVFVGVLLAIEGFRRAFDTGAADTGTKNRRMRMIAKGKSHAEVMQLFRTERAGRNPLARFDAMVKQSGLRIHPLGLLVLAITIAAAVTVALATLLPIVIAATAGLAVGIGGPLLVVRSTRKRRMNRFLQQLPEALDLMTRGLKVGHPVSVTIAGVASDMPDPIGSEFGIVQDRISYGATVPEAFADLAERLPIEDVQYLAVAIGIQHGSGGNLARVLGVLSKVIRSRAMMRKKITAISAEGRFSAMILSGLPLGIFSLISVTSPTYYAEVSDDPAFLPAMGLIVTLVTVQAMILFRLVNFRY